MLSVQKINSTNYHTNFKSKILSDVSKKALTAEYKNLSIKLAELQAQESFLIKNEGTLVVQKSGLPSKIRAIIDKLIKLERILN